MATKHRKPNSSWETDDARGDQPKTCAISGKRIYCNEREPNTIRGTQGHTSPASFAVFGSHDPAKICILLAQSTTSPRQFVENRFSHHCGPRVPKLSVLFQE